MKILEYGKFEFTITAFISKKLNTINSTTYKFVLFKTVCVTYIPTYAVL